MKSFVKKYKAENKAILNTPAIRAHLSGAEAAEVFFLPIINEAIELLEKSPKTPEIKAFLNKTK